MKVDVDKLLQMGVEQRASDLHLLVPSPPSSASMALSIALTIIHP